MKYIIASNIKKLNKYEIIVSIKCINARGIFIRISIYIWWPPPQ